MLQKVTRVISIGVGIIILLLIILNPTYLNFKEFTGISGKEASVLHKKSNFLLFSIYEDKLHDKKYLGIAKNFIDISPPEKATDSAATIATDSVTAVSDSAMTTSNIDSKKSSFDSAKAYDIIDGADTLHVRAFLPSQIAVKKLKALYDAYSQKHDLGTFPHFVHQLNNPIKRRKFYYLISKEYDVGSYSEYSEKINPYFDNEKWYITP